MGPLQRVKQQYQVLLHYFYDKCPYVAAAADVTHDAAVITDKLTDMDQLLSLWMVSPLLEKLNCFVKLCQSRQVFLADLADATTALIEDLDNMYVNEETAFTGEGFEAYTELLAADDDSMLVWEEQDDGEGPEPEVLKIKATSGPCGRATRPSTLS